MVSQLVFLNKQEYIDRPMCSQGPVFNISPAVHSEDCSLSIPMHTLLSYDCNVCRRCEASKAKVVFSLFHFKVYKLNFSPTCAAGLPRLGGEVAGREHGTLTHLLTQERD